MKKTKKTLEYFDYHELVDTIEAKHNVDIRDYKGWSAIMSDQHHRRQAAMDEKFGNTHDERAKEWKNDDPRWSEIDVGDILREGELHYDAVGYCDYWHFMIDYLCEVHNGCVVNINWKEVREYIEEKDGEDDWKIKITDMFIQEVGEDDNDYLIEW